MPRILTIIMLFVLSLPLTAARYGVGDIPNVVLAASPATSGPASSDSMSSRSSAPTKEPRKPSAWSSECNDE